MSLFSFECTKGRHKFQLDIPTKSGQHDEQDDEYKRVRPLIVCSYPGCGASAAKGEIQNSIVAYPAVSGGRDLEALRKSNREATVAAMQMAAAAKGSAPQEKQVELDYIPAGEGPKSAFGGGRITVPEKVVQSLNERDPRPVKE